MGNVFQSRALIAVLVLTYKIQDVIADLDANADNVSLGHDDDYRPTTSDTENIGIFTVGRPPSLEVILSELPPCEEVDRYLSKYFNVEYIALRMCCFSLSIHKALSCNSYHTYLQLPKNGKLIHSVMWQKLINEVQSIL